MTYLVMETHRSYAVLLDETGEFVYAANLNYQVGDRVTDPILMNKNPVKYDSKVIPFSAKVGGFAAVMAVVAALLFIFIRGGQVDRDLPSTVATSIYVSVNPEVRMDLNENGEVVDISGLNADGRSLVLDLNEDLSRQDAIESVVLTSANLNYLQDGGHVRIGIDTDSAHFVQYSKEIDQSLTDLQEELTFTYEILDLRNPEPIEEDDDDQVTPVPAPEPEPEPEPIQEYDEDNDEDNEDDNDVDDDEEDDDGENDDGDDEDDDDD